jgi:hypothetical protein
MFHHELHNPAAWHICEAKTIPDSRDFPLFFLCKSAGHRKPMANGVHIAAFNHALFDAYILIYQCFMFL